MVKWKKVSDTSWFLDQQFYSEELREDVLVHVLMYGHKNFKIRMHNKRLGRTMFSKRGWKTLRTAKKQGELVAHSDKWILKILDKEEK